MKLFSNLFKILNKIDGQKENISITQHNNQAEYELNHFKSIKNIMKRTKKI